MQGGLAWAVGLAAAFAALPVAAQPAPSAYDLAFVAEFEQACVPGRLGYETSLDAARDAGWTPTTADAHPELAAVMALGEAAALDPELEATFAYTVHAKTIEGLPHFLVVSTTSAVISDPDDPWIQTGCYLYNFDATSPLDPAPVTALIGNPISATREGEGATSVIWGPPCPMPMTGDTYLSYIAEGSPLIAQVPMTGIALNFTTTALAEGDPVPEPYC
ncbi:MAG: hypothetical protein ACO1OK_04365 [Devosia sp.]